MMSTFDRIVEGHTCTLETYGFSEKADLRAEDAKLVGGKGYLGISYHLKGLMDFLWKLTFQVNSASTIP